MIGSAAGVCAMQTMFVEDIEWFAIVLEPQLEVRESVNLFVQDCSVVCARLLRCLQS